MEIRELSKLTNVPAKTIRYYEEVKLLPSPNRKPNGYRDYTEYDVDRLKLVAGARRLDFSLAEIKEILDLRDRGIAPCSVLLELLDRKAKEISQRIIELKQMQEELGKRLDYITDNNKVDESVIGENKSRLIQLKALNSSLSLNTNIQENLSQLVEFYNNRILDKKLAVTNKIIYSKLIIY